MDMERTNIYETEVSTASRNGYGSVRQRHIVTCVSAGKDLALYLAYRQRKGIASIRKANNAVLCSWKVHC